NSCSLLNSTFVCSIVLTSERNPMETKGLFFKMNYERRTNDQRNQNSCSLLNSTFVCSIVLTSKRTLPLKTRGFFGFQKYQKKEEHSQNIPPSYRYKFY
ncbi:MAG: hypothetical protein WCS03_14230, partial [Bacteroidota bacterium]